jgi:hypothetical protein
MLHITKLAVGIRDIDELRGWQAERMLVDPPLRHRTRFAPKRRDEVLAGGSIYWVVNGTMLVRQRIVDIIEDTRKDGSACCGLVLDPELVQLEGRPTKAFQGWRYLKAEDAPADLSATGPALGMDALPPALRRELRALCLI